MQAGPLGSVTHSVCLWACSRPGGLPLETPGSSFLKHAQVYIPCQPLKPPAGPTRPSGARGGLPAQGLVPGMASPSLACSRQLDQMTWLFKLSLHHLPGVPSAFPQPRRSACLPDLVHKCCSHLASGTLRRSLGHASALLWHLGVLGVNWRAPETQASLPHPLYCYCPFPSAPLTPNPELMEGMPGTWHIAGAQ